MEQRTYHTSRKPREERRFDKTQLVDTELVHRDYAAHFFRWSWVQHEVRFGAKLLDVGCGAHAPLLGVVATNRGRVRPNNYTGVDLNKINRKSVPAWADVRGEFDFTARYKELSKATFDRVVCFEVIEHMGVRDGDKLLEGVAYCLKPNGRLYLSTPVFSGAAAANHIHEYEAEELAKKIKTRGFNVLKRYGTFARLPAIEKVLTKEERVVFKRMSEFYSHEAMSVFFAVHHPNEASNNMWVCEKK